MSRDFAKVVLLSAIGLTLFSIQPLQAHSDLHLQIEHLTEQISSDPNNTELLLKRGDLYRRHGDWTAGENDFEAVRKMQPGHPRVDWFNGRLLVGSGRFEEGDDLLTRFLASNPDHGGAYRVRAVARGSLDQPLLAADDYQSAIENSKQPSPGLFRSLVLSYVLAGPEYKTAALSATNNGLSHFPNEVSLLGLGANLSLSQSNTQTTLKYMAKVPPGVLNLPQWKFRNALRFCIQGDADGATALLTDILSDMPENGTKRAGTWDLPLNTTIRLATHPRAEECSKAAWEMLRTQAP